MGLGEICEIRNHLALSATDVNYEEHGLIERN